MRPGDKAHLKTLRSTARCAIGNDMLRLWCLALVLISPLCAGGQQIRGAIVDPTGAAIGGTSVRLLKSDYEEVAHATAADSGKFQMGSIGSGNYVLKAWQRGFRSRRVPVAVRSETETIDLGDIRLDLARRWSGRRPPFFRWVASFTIPVTVAPGAVGTAASRMAPANNVRIGECAICLDRTPLRAWSLGCGGVPRCRDI